MPGQTLTFDQLGQIGFDSQAETISQLLFYYGLVQALLVGIPILLAGGAVAATASAALALEIFGYVSITITLMAAIGFYLGGTRQRPDRQFVTPY